MTSFCLATFFPFYFFGGRTLGAEDCRVEVNFGSPDPVDLGLLLPLSPHMASSRLVAKLGQIILGSHLICKEIKSQ